MHGALIGRIALVAGLVAAVPAVSPAAGLSSASSAGDSLMVETSAAAAAPGQAPAAATPLGTLTTSFGFIPGEQIPIKAKSGSLDVRWALIEVEVVPPAEKTGKPAQALRVTLSVANPTGNDVKVAARAIFNDKKGHPLATVEGTDLCEEEDEDELTFRGNFDKALKLIKTVTLEVRSDPATAED